MSFGDYIRNLDFDFNPAVGIYKELPLLRVLSHFHDSAFKFQSLFLVRAAQMTFRQLHVNKVKAKTPAHTAIDFGDLQSLSAGDRS